MSCRIRIAAGSGTIGGGVLELNIQSASSGTKVASATKSQALSSVGVTWVHVTDTWNFTETEIPSDPVFSLEFTTALPASKSIIIDELVLAEVVQNYPGAPGMIIVRGSTDFRTKNKMTVKYQHGSGSTPSEPTNEMQMMFDQLFSTSSMNLNLPTSGSPSIADSLIG